MTEYSKQVLSNPELLRQKLSIYLNGSKSVESYARACEKFFGSLKLISKIKRVNYKKMSKFIKGFMGRISTDEIYYRISDSQDGAYIEMAFSLDDLK